MTQKYTQKLSTRQDSNKSSNNIYFKLFVRLLQTSNGRERERVRESRRSLQFVEQEIIMRQSKYVGFGLVDLVEINASNIFCVWINGWRRRLKIIQYFVRKNVEQLHNYMIVNGLFFLCLSLSLSWCVKCQNMCIKSVVGIFSEQRWVWVYAR